MHVIELILNSGKLALTRNLDDDVGHLCKQVYKLLKFMQELWFSGNLLSQTQTLWSTLNLVACAAKFLEDYFRQELTGEPCTRCLTNVDSPPRRRSCRSRFQKPNFSRVWKTDYDYEEQP